VLSAVTRPIIYYEGYDICTFYLLKIFSGIIKGWDGETAGGLLRVQSNTTRPILLQP
jgi:hypothetical protein